MGLLVEALRARGVEAWGIDLSSYAISQAPDSVKAFCREGSIAAPLTERYDLITCIEVVEHMPAAAAEAAIVNLCGHADDVLFSSTPIDHREPTHVNVQPPEHWAELFARQRFFRDVDFDGGFLTPWTVRYRKSAEPLPRIVRSFERRLARYEHERYDMRAFTAEAQAAQVQAEQMLAHTRDTLIQEIERLRTRLAEAEARAQHRDAAENRAAVAEQTIRNMEQSVFWRLRQLLGRK
jgi:tRNA/tmRNA/rRNA uracil-C5-methylase (TrmA/RlmC/RlmD family)